MDVPITMNKTVFLEIDEMKPEFIVPPVLNPNLKPYVSWTTKIIHQDKLEPESLFSLTYGTAMGRLAVTDIDKFVEKSSKEPLADEAIVALSRMKS